MKSTPTSTKTATSSAAIPSERGREQSSERRHFSLLRTLVIADLLTLANAASGTMAIFMLLRYAETGAKDFVWSATGLMLLSFILDAADGHVARKTRRRSAYGGDLDSLADIVSFGVAPATLGYVVGMRGGWDMVILSYFVACGVARLARFNVTSTSFSTSEGKVSHFEGTPIPTSLILVGVLTTAVGLGAVRDQLWFGEIVVGWTLHPLSLLYAISGTLMTTATLKIPKP